MPSQRLNYKTDLTHISNITHAYVYGIYLVSYSIWLGEKVTELSRIALHLSDSNFLTSSSSACCSFLTEQIVQGSSIFFIQLRRQNRTQKCGIPKEAGEICKTAAIGILHVSPQFRQHVLMQIIYKTNKRCDL